MRARIAVVTGVVVVLASLVAVYLRPRLVHAPPAPQSAPLTLDSRVDWARVSGALALIVEDYSESIEERGKLATRTPAMLRLLERTRALVVKAEPRDEEVERGLQGLRASLEGGVDYEFGEKVKAVRRRISEGARWPQTPSHVPSLEAGARTFATTCAPCHGANANGESEVGRRLQPPAADLLHPERSWRPYDMFVRITYGGLETSMPAFEEGLSEAARWDVVFFLFAKRWWPCDHEVKPLSASDLALSSDFDLSNRFPYADISCLRRHFQ